MTKQTKQTKQTKLTLPVSKVLSESLSLYLINFKILFSVAFVVAILKQAVSFYVNQSVAVQNKQIVVQQPVFMAVSMFLMLAVTVFSSAIIQAYCYNSYSKAKRNFLGCCSFVTSKLLVLLAAGIIASFFTTVGVMLYIFPGVLFFTLLFIYQPLILFNDDKIFSSIRNSCKIVWHNFFEVLVLTIIYLLLAYMPNVIIGYFEVGATKGIGFGVYEVINVFINSLLFPMLCALTLVVYHKLNEIPASS